MTYSNEKKDDEDSQDTPNPSQWTTEMDTSILPMLTNPPTLQIFGTSSNKDGSTTETLIGTTTIDLAPFLYGETDIKQTATIKSTDNLGDIGTMQWISTMDQPLFNDQEIDTNNFMKIRIGSMEDMPAQWAELLLSNDAAETKETKKSKKKQEPVMKHWLECECVLFPDQAPSLKVNLTHKGPVTTMDAVTENTEVEADTNPETDTKRYAMDWSFDSKYLVTGSMMEALIKRSKEDLDQYENPKIKV